MSLNKMSSKYYCLTNSKKFVSAVKLFNISIVTHLIMLSTLKTTADCTKNIKVNERFYSVPSSGDHKNPESQEPMLVLVGGMAYSPFIVTHSNASKLGASVSSCTVCGRL